MRWDPGRSTTEGAAHELLRLLTSIQNRLQDCSISSSVCTCKTGDDTFLHMSIHVHALHV